MKEQISLNEKTIKALGIKEIKLLAESISIGLSKSPKTINLKQINKAIHFISRLINAHFIFDQTEEIYFRKEMIKSLKENYVDKFISFLYDDNMLPDYSRYDARKSFEFIFIFCIPIETVRYIKLNKHLLYKINLSIMRSWAISKSMEYNESLKKLYKDNSFLEPYGMLLAYGLLKNENIIKRETDKEMRIINIADLNQYFEQKIIFLSKLFDRSNFLISPNKKYSDEMFEKVLDLRFQGIKSYKACSTVLKEYFPTADFNQEDSFQRSFNKYLSNK